MPNPVKGEVPLSLSDGRNLTLVADHAALVRAAQAHTGKTKLARFLADLQPLTDGKGKIILDEDGEPVKDTIPATCAMLFGMLEAFHPELTMRDATNILFSEMDKVVEAVGEAMELAWPNPNSSAVGNAPAPKSRAGRNSGRSGAKSARTTKRSGA